MTVPVAARVDILRSMLPRQHIGSVFFVSAISQILIAALLGGCGTGESNSQPQPPAKNVPHGTIDLASNTATITPRARAVTALKTNAEAAGHRFHLLEANGNPLAAVVEIDLHQYEPILLTKTAGIRPGLAIVEAQTSVVVGSGFVSLVRAMEPIGLLQHQNELLSGIEQHGYTRILGITGSPATGTEQTTAPSHFEVVHRSEWLPGLFASALQAGPGIVEQGKLDISERDLQRPKYFRSFVAECGDRALTGISLVPTHLYTLGTALVELFSRENLPCREVVNLAGDREAVLLTSHATTAAYLGDPQPRKVALIAFRQRAKASHSN